MSSKNLIDLRKSRPAEKKTASVRPEIRTSTKRVSPVRVRRRRLRAILGFCFLALVGAAIYGIHYASYLPRFTVGTVTVIGAQHVSPALVRAFVESELYDGAYAFLSHQNILLYPRQKIENAIVAEFPRIKSADISSASMLATAVTVTVEERQPYALWCTSLPDTQDATSSTAVSPGCYQMDQSGFIFAADPAAGVSVQTPYILTGDVATSSTPIGQMFVPAHLPGLFALFTLLEQNNFTPIGASVQSDQDFTVPLTQGFYIKASFGEDAPTLARDLQLVLSADALAGKQPDLEYVDLRFGDRVYYKFKDQDQQNSIQ